MSIFTTKFDSMGGVCVTHTPTGVEWYFQPSSDEDSESVIIAEAVEQGGNVDSLISEILENELTTCEYCDTITPTDETEFIDELGVYVCPMCVDDAHDDVTHGTYEQQVWSDYYASR